MVRTSHTPPPAGDRVPPLPALATAGAAAGAIAGAAGWPVGYRGDPRLVILETRSGAPRRPPSPAMPRHGISLTNS